MEPADLLKLIFLLICLILSAFCSSAEPAFIAFPRARLLHLVNTGHPKANLVSRLIQRPERLLATVLLSNNLVNTAAAAVGTALAISLIGNNTAAVLAGIAQIKPPFLDIAPAGIPPNIIPHSKGVKCGLIHSKSPLSLGNHCTAKRKSPKPLVYAQVSPLGSSFALCDPVTVTNPDAPKVD